MNCVSMCIMNCVSMHVHACKKELHVHFFILFHIMYKSIVLYNYYIPQYSHGDS